MTETASLVVSVDSKDVKTATDDLKKLAATSAATERATDNLGDALSDAAKAAGVYADASGRLREANGRFLSDARKTELGLEKVEGRFKSAGSGAESFGRNIGRLAAAFAGGAFFQSVIANTIESEDALSQLNATIKSTGGAAGLSSDELVAMAQGLQQVTTFGDDAIISMQSQLLTFTKIGKDAVPAATEAILDLATKMGGDLKGAAVQVGKALNDPVKGIAALSKVGVSFTEDQKAVIESLVETGDVAGAQKIILAELAVEFGGSARAARDTFGGALTSLKNSMGDLLEGSGGNLNDAKTAVEDLNKAISDPAVKDAFATITAGILNVAAAAAGALPALTDFTKWVGESLAAAVGGPAADDLVRTSDAIVNLKEELAGFDQQTGLAKYLNKDRVAEMRAELVRLEAQYTAGEAAQAAAYEAQRKLNDQSVVVTETTKTVTTATTKKTQAQKDAEAADKKAADAAAAHAKSLAAQISALEFQASVVGKDKDEVTLLKLALDGATESQLASAQAALGTVASYDEQIEKTKKLKEQEGERSARGKAITQESLSDLEVLAQKQQGYYDALQEGSISQEVFNKASAKNSEAMKEVAYGAGEAGGALNDFAKTAQENIQSQLADNLTEGFNGSFKDILSGWGQLVQRMIAEAAAAQLTESLFGALGVGGAKGGAGGAGALASIGSFFAGFFDNGGNIPSGQFGVVGEKGPEIVRGPVSVTGREDTKRLSGGNTIIINQPGVSNTREAERSAGATRRAVYGAVNSGSRYA